jgi:dienelactone hydrolase
VFPDLIDATRDYWRKLDKIEAAYKRNELDLEEVDAQVHALMADLGQTRRRALREAWGILQAFLQRQGEAVAGFTVVGLLAYVWLVFNGQA